MLIALPLTPRTIPELNPRIAEALRLAREIERLQAQLDAHRLVIRRAMKRARLLRCTGTDGTEALLAARLYFDWKIPSLLRVLSEAERSEFIPRCPQAARLRRHFENDARFAARVRGCFDCKRRTQLLLRNAANLH